jgi:hypothetical protein
MTKSWRMSLSTRALTCMKLYISYEEMYGCKAGYMWVWYSIGLPVQSCAQSGYEWNTRSYTVGRSKTAQERCRKGWAMDLHLYPQYGVNQITNWSQTATGYCLSQITELQKQPFISISMKKECTFTNTWVCTRCFRRIITITYIFRNFTRKNMPACNNTRTANGLSWKLRWTDSKWNYETRV